MLFDGKRILITGGTGSLGRRLTRRILSGEAGSPEKVIVFSRDEAKQHDMRVSFLHRSHATDEVIYENFARVLEFRIGDVRSYADVCGAVRDADMVVHAAALKQVPTCEYFPEQAVLTNCTGAMNIVRAIRDRRGRVEVVIGVSTDKACKPVNVMGMSKAMGERILIAANVVCFDTRFACVRYGNVLASTGSAIPLFQEQIRLGGPVTITSSDMTRFLLSLDRAVDTIFAALAGAYPGETWVPRISSATLLSVALAMVGARKIATRTIGVRPGEKIHEVLISEEEVVRTAVVDGHYVVAPMLPELARRRPGTGEVLFKEFSSADHVLSLEETAAMLSRHRLLDPEIVERRDTLDSRSRESEKSLVETEP
jgi:FlaA1/EpsC-like NDP-sugar epimerase